MDFLLNALNNILDLVTSASFWMKTLQLIMSLSLLVFVHELGHYFFARVFNIRVDKFYLFFNPKFSLLRWDPKKHTLDVCKKNPDEEEVDNKDADDNDNDDDAKAVKTSWRDTVYGLGWVPLGGYCSISGMVDETTSASQLSAKPKPWEFRSRPAYQRLFVMIGGVLFNFLTACLIYAGMTWYWGERYVPLQNYEDGMRFSESAHAIGFKDGDILLSADGTQVSTDIKSVVTAKNVTVLRNKKDTVTLAMPKDYILKMEEEVKAQNNEKKPLVFAEAMVPVVIKAVNKGGADKAGLKVGDRMVAVNGVSTPDYRSFSGELAKNKDKEIQLLFLRNGKQDSAKVQIDGDGLMGIALETPDNIFKPVVNNYGFLESLGLGFSRGWNELVSYVTMFKYVFSKAGVKSLGSFGAIGSLFGETINWYSFWYITALLSIMLAFMNILPIPILDGGYVLFLIIEMITGWKPSEKFMDIALRIGFTLILILMVFALGNDFYRFILK